MLNGALTFTFGKFLHSHKYCISSYKAIQYCIYERTIIVKVNSLPDKVIKWPHNRVNIHLNLARTFPVSSCCPTVMLNSPSSFKNIADCMINHLVIDPFPIVVVTNHHKLCGLKQHKFIILQLGRLEVQNQVH